MGTIVLACGIDADGVPGKIVTVPASPDKSDVDPVLAQLEPDDGRIVVIGRDADLAAVVLRMLRRDRLDVELGFLPAGSSEVAALWGLRSTKDRVELAMHGPARPTTLVRDDAGGVLVGKGTLTSVNGIAYGDNDVLLRGAARRIDVQPDLAADGLGLVVSVQSRRFRRPVITRSRAFQLGCDPVYPVLDGVRRERAAERWTWYRHTADLLVARP